MSRNRIDTVFVDEWSALYLPERDAHVLHEVHPRVEKQHFYDADDALAVIRRKSRRTKGYLQRNEPDDIMSITAMALKAPKHLAHRVLGTCTEWAIRSPARC